MNNEPLPGAEQVMGDDERADRIVAGAASRIADNVRVALHQTGEFCRVETSVHAGKNGELARRRHSQRRPFSQRLGIRFVGFQNFFQ